MQAPTAGAAAPTPCRTAVGGLPTSRRVTVGTASPCTQGAVRSPEAVEGQESSPSRAMSVPFARGLGGRQGRERSTRRPLTSATACQSWSDAGSALLCKQAVRATKAARLWGCVRREPPTPPCSAPAGRPSTAGYPAHVTCTTSTRATRSPITYTIKPQGSNVHVRNSRGWPRYCWPRHGSARSASTAARQARFASDGNCSIWRSMPGAYSTPYTGYCSAGPNSASRSIGLGGGSTGSPRSHRSP